MLGLKKVKVRINSLGDVDTRENYKKALMEYFAPHIKDLCEDCQARFSKNPLRILDCKVDKDNPILKNAPKILDYLNTESQAHFDAVLKYLEALDIDYEVDSRVIRGLDYYTHAVFEIEAEIEGFGSQNVICAGGRYDNLVGDLEGPDTKAVGFAIGLERLMLALEKENIAIPDNNYLDVYLIYLGEEAKENLKKFKEKIRNEDIYEVTALINDGLDKVIDRLSTLVKEIDREVLYTDDVQESHVLYKFKKEKPFTISKDKDVFVVRGDSIEKLFRMTNFNTEEAYERFSNKLRKMGLDEELIKNGIEEGDTVRILDFEFEWTR